MGIKSIRKELTLMEHNFCKLYFCQNLSRQAMAGRISGYRSGAEGPQERRPVYPAEAVGVEVQQALPQGGAHGGQRHQILQCAQVLTAPEEVGRAVAAQLHRVIMARAWPRGRWLQIRCPHPPGGHGSPPGPSGAHRPAALAPQPAQDRRRTRRRRATGPS
uniref:Uncharacterized protein LOC117313895 isoform X4 n=1 Tax=Tursiops truncatus TaxID=9739 RepID=A0A6J3S0Y1_TURTR|nr:uncharacterized protein LOC117313895 isoform X4 [Tursiops truncatus]